MLVIEGHTPENNLTQAVFNVAELDISDSGYVPDTQVVRLVCRNNGGCITGSVWEGSSEQAARSVKDRGQYRSMDLLTPSEDGAQRILADLQELQRLEQ